MRPIDTRPSIDKTMMMVADVLSLRSTCARRRVGCVLTDDKNRIIGTGYNGVARGHTHCIDQNCPGATAESGTQLDTCQALHAEWNALQQCRNVDDIHNVYCTTSPCVTCTKMFLNTGAVRIVVAEQYADANEACQLWTTTKPGAQWQVFSQDWRRMKHPGAFVITGVSTELRQGS